MCNVLVSLIIKATVSAPREPYMSCRSGVLHYCSHVHMKSKLTAASRSSPCDSTVFLLDKLVLRVRVFCETISIFVL